MSTDVASDHDVKLPEIRVGEPQAHGASLPGTRSLPRRSAEIAPLTSGGLGQSMHSLEELDDLSGSVEVEQGRGATTLFSIDWPWSGSLLRHTYADVLLYVLLLVLFSAITLVPAGRRSYDGYNFAQSVQQTLLAENRPEPEIGFSDIQELSGLRRWLRAPFFLTLYGHNPNDPDEEDSDQEPTHLDGLYLASTTILGPIRLRQLRVRAASCSVDKLWKGIIEVCHAAYNKKGARIAASDPFHIMWGNQTSTASNVTAPPANDRAVGVEDRTLAATSAAIRAAADVYLADLQDENVERSRRNPPNPIPEPDVERAIDIAVKAFAFTGTEAGWYRGRLISNYRPQGFVADLPEADAATARLVLHLLDGQTWLDAQSRALFVEFSLFLAERNTLLAARLVIEIHPTGTTWTDFSLEPLHLDEYSIQDNAQFWLILVLMTVVLASLAWDVYSTWVLRMHQSRRTGSAWLWNAIGFLLYCGICAAGGLYIYNLTQMRALRFSANTYLPVHELGYTVSIERGLWAMCSFVIWFRLLKFTTQLPVFGILGRTIGRALPQVIAFFLISCIIFFAFAQAFFMAFYASVDGYQTYPGAIMSVIRFTVLDFDYKALSDENRLLTPVLFSLILLVVFFIWVNIMVAIISEVYEQEHDRTLVIKFDEDFAAMAPTVMQPENDLAAMREHLPIRTSQHCVVDTVTLLPQLFERFRIAPLRRFNKLVTVDMYAHFKALEVADDAANSEQPSRPLTAPDACAQHAGVYARLGSAGFVSRARRVGPAPEDQLDVNSGPMELQALYFDKTQHNITSARLWWARHKHMFDASESLKRHILNSSSVTMVRITSRLKRNVSSTAAGMRKTLSNNHRQAALHVIDEGPGDQVAVKAPLKCKPFPRRQKTL